MLSKSACHRSVARGVLSAPADDWTNSKMARKPEDPQYELRLALEDALARRGLALAAEDAVDAEVLAVTISGLRRRLAQAEKRAAEYKLDQPRDHK